jgi:hypothetical protein
MSTPEEKANPTDAKEKARKSEVAGRSAEPSTTVPQDGVTPDTSVPQDDE